MLCNKTSLVTGACGFVGSNLANKLLEIGEIPDCVDNLVNGHVSLLNDQLHENNLLIQDFSSDVVLDKIRSGKYDVVYHLAAIPRISYSVDNPLETHEANVTKTMKLIDACKGNIKRLVFASSSSVYGGGDGTFPIHESCAKNVMSPYALQKSHIEDMLSLYWNLYGFESASLRFFTVFGPGQIGSSPYCTAVASWLTAIKNDLPMRSDGDGTQSRDMCYVDNTVEACIKAGSSKNELMGRQFNIARGDRISNKEILDYLKIRFPHATSYDSPRRQGDVNHTQADTRRAKEEFDFSAKIDFWQGLDKTIDWFENNWDRIKDM